MIHSPEQLRQTRHLDPAAHIDILEAAEETYATLIQEYGCEADQVHYIGLCAPASQLMVENLHQRGYRAKKEFRSMPIYHRYVVLPSERTEEDVLVDATWQQFLARRLACLGLPRVMIGVCEEVVGRARFYGMDERFQSFYNPLMTVNSSAEPVQ